MSERETLNSDQLELRISRIELEGDKAYSAEWRRRLWLPLLITAASLVVLVATFNALGVDTWGVISAIMGELFLMSLTWLYWIARAEVASYRLMYELALSDLRAQAAQADDVLTTAWADLEDDDDDDDTEDAVN